MHHEARSLALLSAPQAPALVKYCKEFDIPVKHDDPGLAVTVARHFETTLDVEEDECITRFLSSVSRLLTRQPARLQGKTKQHVPNGTRSAACRARRSLRVWPPPQMCRVWLPRPSRRFAARP